MIGERRKLKNALCDAKRLILHGPTQLRVPASHQSLDLLKHSLWNFLKVLTVCFQNNMLMRPHPQVCNIVRMFYLVPYILHMTNPFPQTNHHTCSHFHKFWILTSTLLPSDVWIGLSWAWWGRAMFLRMKEMSLFASWWVPLKKVMSGTYKTAPLEKAADALPRGLGD